jgi:drug/metabolite transporter (DMT)-like permease
MTSLGAVGYVLLIISIRMAEVSVVTPFRYSRIIFLMAMGVIIFGERPDGWTLFGAGLVIASGVYIIWRERRAKHIETTLA